MKKGRSSSRSTISKKNEENEENEENEIVRKSPVRKGKIAVEDVAAVEKPKKKLIFSPSPKLYSASQFLESVESVKISEEIKQRLPETNYLLQKRFSEQKGDESWSKIS